MKTVYIVVERGYCEDDEWPDPDEILAVFAKEKDAEIFCDHQPGSQDIREFEVQTKAPKYPEPGNPAVEQWNEWLASHPGYPGLPHPR